jgi:hypothetical protein
MAWIFSLTRNARGAANTLAKERSNRRTNFGIGAGAHRSEKILSRFGILQKTGINR